MIAANFRKFPEALRFQREMFSNGYHNSPRIMRLMECIMDFAATVPAWVKEAAARAKRFAKHLAAKQIEINFNTLSANEAVQKIEALMAKGFFGYFGRTYGQTWSGRGLMPTWAKQEKAKGTLVRLTPKGWHRA